MKQSEELNILPTPRHNNKQSSIKAKEMENLSSQIDLFLTEISIELLDNKMYDISGKRQDKIINLFKALPEEQIDKLGKCENSNDFLCSLSGQNDLSAEKSSEKQMLNEQLDYILEEANSTTKSNEEIINFLRTYKRNQRGLVDDISNMKFKRITGEYSSCKYLL